MRPSSGFRRNLVICWALVALAWGCPLVHAMPQPVQEEQGKPNIVLINLDDADFEMLSPENLQQLYPNLYQFATDGTRFTNFHVTTPLCGPSRASLLRGQYAYSTGIRANDPLSYRSNGFPGGMQDYGEAGYHEDDISMWMKSAGYRTMMVGKFLHSDVVNIVPSGWDDFFSSRGANYYGTARFTNRDSEGGTGYLEPINVYRTTQESSEALGLIDQHVARDNDQPFFMYLAPLAPHQPTPHNKQGMIEAQYQDWWTDAQMPRDPSINEWEFGDKSTAIRHASLMSQRDLGKLDRRHRERLLSVKSIDDFFGALTEKLNRHGLADNTFIFLTSDNGFSNGHHRLIGKSDCFDVSTHVPMYVLGPGIPGGVEANHLLAHIDIAPTIAELANARTSTEVDGKSFAPLLFDLAAHDERLWRDAILIENWETRTINGADYNAASLALRMYESVYAEWADGSPEFYDLAADPLQLENVWESMPESERTFLAGYLKSFRNKPRAPDTTISQPFLMNSVASRLLPIKGMAEDDSGISTVELVIKRFSDSWFWNGEDWQPGSVVLEADVTRPGQQLTTWTYSDIPHGQPTDDLIGLWAQARDTNGNVDESQPWVVFRMDYTRPTSTITHPESSEPIETLSINGETEDEGGVASIRLVIRELGTGQYYDGKNWVSEWTWFEVPAKLNGRWTWANENLQGYFLVSARAVDHSGNEQSPPTQMRIIVQP